MPHGYISESTQYTGLDDYCKYLHPCDLNESSLRIGKVKRGWGIAG